jgi:hypothetical protein
MKPRLRKSRQEIVSELRSGYKDLGEAFTGFREEYEGYTEMKPAVIIKELIDSHEENNFECVIRIKAEGFFYDLFSDWEKATRTLRYSGRYLSAYENGYLKRSHGKNKLKFLEGLTERLRGYTEYKGDLNKLSEIR